MAEAGDKLALSVAIITKNEEANILACHDSVSFADDVVVVDSGSTDATVEMARSRGCRVFVEDWKGYGPQKQSAVDKCKHEWVLLVDADERIPTEMRNRISEILKSPNADAYSFPRKNFLHGRWIKHSDWWPDRVIRLVRRKAGGFKNITHEIWTTKGVVDHSISEPIEHISFSGYPDMLAAMERYSTALAKDLYSRGERTNALSPVIHAMAMFIKIYFIKLGILDGREGFMIAKTKAGGAYLKYAKLLELQRKGSK